MGVRINRTLIRVYCGPLTYPLHIPRWISNANPLVVTAVASVLTLLLIGGMESVIPHLLGEIPLWSAYIVIVVLIVSLLVVPLSVIVLAVSYARAHFRIQRLVFTYLALILLFANIYFITITFDDRGGSPCAESSPDSFCIWNNDIPMQGVQPVWKWMYWPNGRHITWHRIWLSYIDCFHYSVVTGSTVGFGDIHPSRWYTKLLTDLQILLSIGLTVLGVSRLFTSARGSAPESSSKPEFRNGAHRSGILRSTARKSSR
jgi:hypothetical protein